MKLTRRGLLGLIGAAPAMPFAAKALQEKPVIPDWTPPIPKAEEMPVHYSPNMWISTGEATTLGALADVSFSCTVSNHVSLFDDFDAD